MNTSNAGVVESQVFQGTGSLAGLYAYAYQFGVNNVTDIRPISQPASTARRCSSTRRQSQPI